MIFQILMEMSAAARVAYTNHIDAIVLVVLFCFLCRILRRLSPFCTIFANLDIAPGGEHRQSVLPCSSARRGHDAFLP